MNKFFKVVSDITFGALTFGMLTLIGYAMTIVAVVAAVFVVPFGALAKAVEIFGE